MSLNNLISAALLKDNLITFDKAINKTISVPQNDSVIVLPENPNRIYAIIVNPSKYVVTLNFGEERAEIGKGLILNGKGSSYEITFLNLFVGAITAICGAKVNIGVIECSL